MAEPRHCHCAAQAVNGGTMRIIQSSIRNKLILALMIVTIIPFSLSIVVTYFQTKQNVYRTAVQDNSDLLSNAGLLFELYIDQVNQSSLLPYGKPRMTDLIRSGIPELEFEKLNRMDEMLQTIMYSNDTQRSVKIYSLSTNQSYDMTRQSVMQINEWEQRSQYELMFQEAMDHPYFLHIHSEPAHASVQSRKVYFQRAYIHSPHRAFIGFISIELDRRSMAQLTENLYTKGESDIYVLNDMAEIIYTSDAEADKYNDLFAVIKERPDQGGHMEWEKDGFKSLINFKKLDDRSGGIILVKKTAVDALFQDGKNVMRVQVAITMATFSLVLITIVLVSVRIVLPIRRLVRHIRKIKTGAMEEELTNLGKDEIGVLGEEFNAMMRQIKHLIQTEYELKLRNKINELKALQAQINPHFLYNALQSIAGVVYDSSDKKAYKLVTSLSRMLRFSMNQTEAYVTLEREMEHVRAYLELQQYRFESDLIVQFDISPVLLPCSVPRMSIQPLIENYFKHAFHKQHKQGVLRITGVIAHDQAVLTVSDNGCGMTQAKIESISRAMRSHDAGFQQEGEIGLLNILRRFRIGYGDTFHYELINNLDGGLDVILSFPVTSLRDGSEGGEAVENVDR